MIIFSLGACCARRFLSITLLDRGPGAAWQVGRQSAQRVDRSGSSNPNRSQHGKRYDEATLGGRRPFWTPHSPLESQDASRISLRSAAAFTSLTCSRPCRRSTASTQVVRDTVAKGGTVLFVGTKAPGPGDGRARSAARRHALHQPAMAGWHADQLGNHTPADSVFAPDGAPHGCW